MFISTTKMANIRIQIPFNIPPQNSCLIYGQVSQIKKISILELERPDL